MPSRVRKFGHNAISGGSGVLCSVKAPPNAAAEAAARNAKAMCLIFMRRQSCFLPAKSPPPQQAAAPTPKEGRQNSTGGFPEKPRGSRRTESPAQRSGRAAPRCSYSSRTTRADAAPSSSVVQCARAVRAPPKETHGATPPVAYFQIKPHAPPLSMRSPAAGFASSSADS